METHSIWGVTTTQHRTARGVLPIAPTPFTESGDVDFDGERRVLDCMIDQGVDAICVLANFSEQFLLTDEERDRLTELGLTHVAGRVPVIVTCSHFSTRIAAERGRRAASLGASMLMLMPPYHGVSLRADENGIVRALRRRRRGGAHPVDGAGCSALGRPAVGAVSRAPREERAARELVQDRSAGAAAKLRALIAAGGDAIVGPFDGEESVTLMADLEPARWARCRVRCCRT